VALTAADYEVHRATRRMLAREPDRFMNLVRRSLRRRNPELHQLLHLPEGEVDAVR
jgi:hypothetical protein